MSTTSWHQGNPDIIHDAHLAQAAYSGASEVMGWQKDLELSGEDHAVFHKGGKAKIAYRGTNVKNKKDLEADALITLGLQDHSNRFKRAVRTADQVTAKYGKENTSLTGHSLGGSQAAYVSRKKGLKATGFGAAKSPVDAHFRKRTYTNFHSVSTAADPISIYTRKTARIGKHSIVRQKTLNPHSLANYL